MNELITPFQIKGLRDGLLITLGQGEWPELEEALLAHITSKQAFFKGARIALEIGHHPLRVNQLSDLREVIGEGRLSLGGGERIPGHRKDCPIARAGNADIETQTGRAEDSHTRRP